MVDIENQIENYFKQMRENPDDFDRIFGEMITYYRGYVDSMPNIQDKKFGMLMIHSFQNHRKIDRLQKTNIELVERIVKLEKELGLKNNE